MVAQVLGISGSPIPTSNTDRAIKEILAATGLRTEFVKLSRLALQPCRACLGCTTTNQCVVDDDCAALVEKFRQASAFVIGGYTPYSSLDARTKMFMERLYCLRHNRGLNRGKPGVAVVTTACAPDRPGLPPAAPLAHQQLALWMMEEGMAQVGALTVVGNVPCVRCGFGDSCEQSGIKMLHGPAGTVASVGTTAFELQPAVLAAARELGAKLKAAVLAARA